MYPDNFEIPLVENVQKGLPEEDASSQAFYGAAAYNENFSQDYQKIYEDLKSTGTSDLFETSKKRWMEEQDAFIKSALPKIIADPSIDYNTKKDLVLKYSVGGGLSKDLRDKYIQRVSTTPYTDSPVEEENQTKYKSSITKVKAALDEARKKEAQEEGESWGIATLQGLGLAGVDIAQGIVAGLGGALYTLKKWDPIAGQTFMGELTEKWRLNPRSNKSEDIRNGIANVLSVATIPGEALTEALTEATGKASLSLVASVGAEAVVGAKVSTATSPMLKKAASAIVKPILNAGIKKKSPLQDAAVANPKVAEDLIKTALQDETEVTARNLGTTKGEIYNDTALPSLDTVPDLNLMPDFHEQLIISDREFQKTYDYQRFDETVQTSATERRNDLDTVLDVIKQTAPYYHQNKSSIQNIEGNVYEGYATYGKDNARFFSTKDEVAEFLPTFQEAVKNAKDHLNATITVVDQTTNSVYKNLNEVPAEGNFAFRLDWKKEYDDVTPLFFKPNSVTSSISLGPKWLGLSNIDVSKLARSPSSWWFLNIGTLPKFVDQGLARMAPRTAKMEGDLLRDLQKFTASTKHPKEFMDLIEDAEIENKDWYSTKEISDRYTYLDSKGVEDVFMAYTAARRVSQRLHSVVNINKRTELFSKGFDRGLYVNGKYINIPVNNNWRFNSIDEAKAFASEVWDFDLDMPNKFEIDPNKLEEGSIDVTTGRRLVKLANPYEDPLDPLKVYEYALAGGTKSKVDILPQRVVPRVKGYFPLKTDENFFISATPVYRNINGRITKNDTPAGADKLANYAKVIAAGRTMKEVNKIKEALEKQNRTRSPEERVIYTVNRDRSVSFNSFEKELEARTEINRAAQKRGPTLYNLSGVARREDRFVTLVNTIRSMSRQNASRLFDENFQRAFEKSFSGFIPDGKFPAKESDISFKGATPSLETEARVAEARAIYRKYARLNSFGTFLDEKFQTIFHSIADIIDDFTVPADLLRKLGNKGNFITTGLKVFTSTLFINLYPQRQWIVQMSSLLDIMAMQGLVLPKAVFIFQNTAAIRMALMAESNYLNNKNYGPIAKKTREAAQKMSSMDKKEFEDTLNAIRSSGLLESIDLNMLVQGVVKDLSVPLVESQMASVLKAPGRAVGMLSRGSRAIGFDAAEATNRVGLWLAAKQLWQEKNPGKDWNTIKNIEEISYEEFRLSGSMSRAGAYAYQEGFPSLFMQFSAISQKMLMNVIQDNATFLSPSQRARLAAARLLMYGPRFGLPAGALVHHYANNVEDEEAAKWIKEAEKGIVDHMVNGLIYLTTDQKGDLNLSTNLSSYSQYGLPAIETIFEFYKAFDDKPANPKFPAIGAAGAIEEVGSFWKNTFRAKEFTEENAPTILYESLKFASGMGATGKAVLMYELGDKFTKAGIPLGMRATGIEAIAQFVGVGTFREESLYEGAVYMGDYSKIIKDTAKDAHGSFVKLYKDSDEATFMTSAKYLGSYMGALKGGDFWGEPELDAFYKAFMDLEKDREKSLKDSVTMKLLQKASSKNNEALSKSYNALSSTLSPEKQKEFSELFKIMRGEISNGTE